jgi:NTE family protein
VQINPVFCKGIPKTAQEIQNRVNEISFNASLLKELRYIRDINALVAAGELDATKHRCMRLHRIEAQERLGPLGASSKLNTEWAFLEHLFDIGRDVAGTWLAKNYDHIGKHPTLDLDELFAEQ